MSQPRKHMSVSTQRDAALNALGLLGYKLNWDHCPPLAMREKVKDEDGNVIGYIPDENDPRYIVPMLAEAHKDKTNGKPHDASNGDLHKIAKFKRLEKQHQEFISRLTAPEPREENQEKSRWPKRKFQNRKRAYK